MRQSVITTAVLVTLAVACLCPGVYGYIPRFAMNFACDDEMNIYADYNNDPELLATNNNWRTIITARVPTMTKVLSISCLNYGGPSGILAGTRKGVILTNSTWLCSSEYEEGWNTQSFDDNHWKPAKYIDSNSHPTGHYGWKTHSEPTKENKDLTINPNAYWIGADGVDMGPRGSTSYCRLKLVYYFTMVCDDYSELYADGVFIGDQEGFQSSSFVMQIPKLATVFAVNCTNLGSFHGFIGSTNDSSLITDKQWRIYSQYRNVSEADQKKFGGKAKRVMTHGPPPPEDWNQPTFDDSDWITPEIVLNNKLRKPNKPNKIPWPHIIYHKEISEEALWLSGKPEPTADSVEATDRSSYFFRRNLGCMWTDTCRNINYEV